MSNRREGKDSKCKTCFRRNTRYFFIFCNLTVTAVLFGGLMKAEEEINLPMKGSFPYDHKKDLAFRLTYFFQAISIYIGVVVTVGSETFVMTMMIQICSQLDIMFHRLECLPLLSGNEKTSSVFSAKEAKIVRNCIIHHNCIYRYFRVFLNWKSKKNLNTNGHYLTLQILSQIKHHF